MRGRLQRARFVCKTRPDADPMRAKSGPIPSTYHKRTWNAQGSMATHAHMKPGAKSEKKNSSVLQSLSFHLS